jgi:hypothetical protein
MALNEVVVAMHQHQKKSVLTGSVTMISSTWC